MDEVTGIAYLVICVGFQVAWVVEFDLGGYP